jgi:hypothetical protein
MYEPLARASCFKPETQQKIRDVDVLTCPSFSSTVTESCMLEWWNRLRGCSHKGSR